MRQRAASSATIVGYNWQSIKSKISGDSKGTGTQVTEQQDGSLKVNIPNSISFDTNSYAIKPSFDPVLNSVTQTMQQHPELIANVVGHTDNTGQPVYNQTLSQNRAQSVASYISSHGVAAQRLSSQGMGQNQPIADNSTEARAARRIVAWKSICARRRSRVKCTKAIDLKGESAADPPGA